ncbi:hypothetical protein CS542_01025 [Pedobacter sp. IW39]|nr:hypothetical protein CS542_01025 [Pedobacter sp. IW39]
MHIAEALKLEDQEKTVVLKLPDVHSLYNSSNHYKVKDLYDFYAQAFTYGQLLINAMEIQVFTIRRPFKRAFSN